MESGSSRVIRFAFQTGHCMRFFDGSPMVTGEGKPSFGTTVRSFQQVTSPRPECWPLSERLKARSQSGSGLKALTCDTNIAHCCPTPSLSLAGFTFRRNIQGPWSRPLPIANMRQGTSCLMQNSMPSGLLAISRPNIAVGRSWLPWKQASRPSTMATFILGTLSWRGIAFISSIGVMRIGDWASRTWRISGTHASIASVQMTGG